MHIAQTDCFAQTCASQRKRQRYAAQDKCFSASSPTSRLRILLALVLALCGARASVAQIDTLTFDPPVLGKGQSTTATFTLARVLPDITFTLSSSDPANVPVPPSITIPSGTLSVTFIVKPNPAVVPEVVNVFVTDSIGNSVVGQLMLLTIPAFTTTLSPTRIESGECAFVTFTLAEPAPIGGEEFQPVLFPFVGPIQFIGFGITAGSTTTTLRIRTFPKTIPTTLHIQFIEITSNIPSAGWFGGQVLGLTENAGDLVILPPTQPHNCPDAEGPTFSITDLELPVGGTSAAVKSPAPVQVVFNPHASTVQTPNPDPGPFDLVLGKATAFLVGVNVDQLNLVPATGVEVQLNFGNTLLPSVFVSPGCQQGQTMNCFQTDGTATALINTGFSPQTTGTGITVSTTVNPPGANHIPEGDGTTTGKSAEVQVNVLATNDLNVAYVRVDGCDLGDPSLCYGLLSAQAAATTSASNNFIKRTYPVSDSVTLRDLGPDFIRGSALGFGVPTPAGLSLRRLGMLFDFYNAQRLGLGLTPPPKRVIGVVPTGYFAYRGLPHTLGVTPLIGAHVSLVVEGNSDTASAHELGHQIGIGLPEEYVTAHQFGLPGNRASGFWVAGDQLIDPAFCFMGNQPFFNDPRQVGKTWVDNQHFEFLFEQLTNPVTDPEILLFGAIIGRDGSVELLPWQRFAQGSPTQSTGDYAIQLADFSGNIVGELTVPVSFQDIVDPITFESSSLDSALISVAVAYPQNAITASLIHDGNVIVHVNIPSKLLADTIRSIPDSAFDKNPSERRNALLNKISSFDSQLASGDRNGAVSKLQNDIRKHLDQWLVDGYTVSSSLQYTKVQVLELTDELIHRLSSN